MSGEEGMILSYIQSAGNEGEFVLAYTRSPCLSVHTPDRSRARIFREFPVLTWAVQAYGRSTSKPRLSSTRQSSTVASSPSHRSS